MKHDTADEKPPKSPRTPRVKAALTQEEIDAIVDKKVSERMAAQPAPTIIVQTPTPTPATVVETEPAVEAHNFNVSDTVHDIENKAEEAWYKARGWKYFWWVLAVVALVLLYLGFRWVNSAQEKKEEARLDQKKEELKRIQVGGDTSLLQLKVMESQKISRQDSINEILLHVLTDLAKVREYQKGLLPQVISIDNETKIVRDKINTPANSDDVRNNARRELSK